MVDYAKQNYPECQFLKMNMLDIEKVQGDFDLVLCICTTLCYLTDQGEINAFFSAVFNKLNDSGIFIFDVFNPISFLEKVPFTGNYFGESNEGYSEVGLKYSVKHTIDEASQILTEEKCVAKIDGLDNDETCDTTRFRMYFPQELRLLMDNHSFTNIRQYGKYIDGYGNLDSSRIVTVCEKQVVGKA
jgi:SAM-dependent methyltransferase